MTGSRHHAADDGSLARSTGGAAARGAMLIALAVVIGLVLLAFVLDDPSTVVAGTDDAVEQTEETDDSSSDDADATGDDAVNVGTPDESADDQQPAVIPEDEDVPVIETTVPTGDTRVPAEVNILAANGTGGRGVAGAVANQLIARGYIAEASNTGTTNTEASIVYYREGYANDARAVAEILGSTAELLQPVPADGVVNVASNAIEDGRLDRANVVVIVGTDGRIPVG